MFGTLVGIVIGVALCVLAFMVLALGVSVVSWAL